MDRYKVNGIIDYIWACRDFPYDTDDVIEDLNGILTSYSICSVLDSTEYYQIMDELLELAEKAEISEAVRWASLQLECGMDLRLACDYRIPGYI